MKKRIREALNLFVARDKGKLLEVDIYEPTISHRIAVYLEGLFPNYDVDCEYNKHLFDEKGNEKGKPVRPDIVVHKRLTDNNCAIIEVKKAGAKSKLAEHDIQKLKLYLQGKLNYDLGVFIGVLKKRIDIVWVENKNDNIIITEEELNNYGRRNNENNTQRI